MRACSSIIISSVSCLGVPPCVREQRVQPQPLTSLSNWREFRFQGESSGCIFMPGTFEKDNIAANNATSSHLNDNFVLLCAFPCIQGASAE